LGVDEEHHQGGSAHQPTFLLSFLSQTRWMCQWDKRSAELDK